MLKISIITIINYPRVYLCLPIYEIVLVDSCRFRTVRIGLGFSDIMAILLIPVVS